jgi:hypothetical protein
LRRSAAAWLLACGCAVPLLAGCGLPDRELGVERLELARFTIGDAETTTVRLRHT